MILQLKKFQYRDAGYLFLWGLLAIQAFGFLLSFLPTAFSGNLMIMGALNNLVLVGVYFLYARTRGVSPLKAGNITTKFSPWAILVALAFAPLLQLSLGGSMELFNRVLQMCGYTSVNILSDLTFMEYGIGGLVGYILISGVMTGICEELLFRGGILSALRDKFSDPIAIIISAAAFMLFHTSPDQTIFQFGLALALGYLTIKTGSVIPAMVVHIANNVLSIVMTAYKVTWWMPSDWGYLIDYALIGLVLGLMLLPLLIDVVTKSVRTNVLISLFRRRSKCAEGTARGNEGSVEWRDENVRVDELGEHRKSEIEETDILVLNAKANKKAEDRAGTFIFWVGVFICVALWIAQLVMGFITEAV